MTPSERHAWVAGTFSDRVDGVRDWEAPAPVPGWVARDVVAHLVDWMPGFLAGGGVTLVVDGPTVAEDPVGAWHAMRRPCRPSWTDPMPTGSSATRWPAPIR